MKLVVNSKPIDLEMAWSPDGSIKTYKYFQAVIALLPNGDYLDEEVCGKNRVVRGHYQGVVSVIERLKNKYTDDQLLIELLDKMKDMTINPFYLSVECANNGVLILLIEGENAQIYFPKNVTSEQVNKLLELLSSDLKDLIFRLFYDNEEYYEYIDVDGNSRDLKSNDIFRFMLEHHIVMDNQNMEENKTDSGSSQNKKM